MLTKKRTSARVVAAGAVILAAATWVLAAGQAADEALAKKYANILGKYRIEVGEQTAILEFAIRQGALWADSGDGRPAEMKPVNDSLVKFIAQDSMNGLFEIEFQKDETGAFTKCRVINQSMELDVVAVKIKEN